MRRRLLFVCVLITLTAQTLLAQEKLNILKAPASPASSVLGVQPSAVLTPKSFQALEAAVYSNFTNSDGNALIPNDFALEFTPYWFKDRGLLLQDYLYPKSGWEKLKMASSFSIASTQNYILGDETETNSVAFGYRTSFYFPNNADKVRITAYQDTLEKADDFQLSFNGEVATLIANSATIKTKLDFLLSTRAQVTSELIKLLKLSSPDAEKLVAKVYSQAEALPELDKTKPGPFISAFTDMVFNEVKEHKPQLVYGRFKDYIRERQGLYVDIAYGTFLNFPTADFSYSVVPRQSVWITPHYRFADKFNWLRAMVVLRYEWSDSDYYKRFFPESNVYQNNLDYGVALSGDYHNFIWQLEGIGRRSNSELLAGTDEQGNQLYRRARDTDFQYIGKVGYRLNDALTLTYSLGNRFRPILDESTTLVSLLSLNFGFGGPTSEIFK